MKTILVLNEHCIRLCFNVKKSLSVIVFIDISIMNLLVSEIPGHSAQTINVNCFDRKENGFDCLLIAKGDVSLPGHEYGFIGGASAKISESEVLFFGDITKHRDYKKIADFIKKYGYEIISLDFPLTDFGGIIPIIEETP